MNYHADFDQRSCCPKIVTRDGNTLEQSAPIAMASTNETEALDLIDIPGGKTIVGTNQPFLPMDGEGPLRAQRIKPFRIMATAVTNAQFARFVEATGYRTEAERFGWSYVFVANVPDKTGPTQAVAQSPWWRRVDGAYWRCVNGPDDGHETDLAHPAVHVTLRDAEAFAHWHGGRLPSETEWEHAARGGLGDVAFPWGNREPDDEDFQPCNIWQGRFPEHNTMRDGYASTAPARSFAPNGYGLFNMSGNVWEWTSDRFRIRSLRKDSRRHAEQMRGTQLLKGGSFLCHKSYCFRYRIAARTGTTQDTSTAHQGFRIVLNSSHRSA